MKNKLFIIFCLVFGACMPSFANPPAVTGANIPKVTSEQKPAVVTTEFGNCVKTFNTDINNLYYLTLAAINASGYKLDETQSRTGLITFVAGNKTFLVSITLIDSKTSMIKITPADNSYAFSPIIPERIFTYLTNNIIK